jgi:hypothetical protein
VSLNFFRNIKYLIKIGERERERNKERIREERERNRNKERIREEREK